LEAARIVTGLTCHTSLESRYRKTGWETLSTRREVNTLYMFNKLNIGNSPVFLCDLIPPSVGETNNYNLRNRHNISQTTSRLSISQQSFFSVDDQVMEFNRSENSQLPNFESFKYKLKHYYFKNAKKIDTPLLVL
jgi:hypothetical protein